MEPEAKPEIKPAVLLKVKKLKKPKECPICHKMVKSLEYHMGRYHIGDQKPKEQPKEKAKVVPIEQPKAGNLVEEKGAVNVENVPEEDLPPLPPAEAAPGPKAAAASADDEGETEEKPEKYAKIVSKNDIADGIYPLFDFLEENRGKHWHKEKSDLMPASKNTANLLNKWLAKADISPEYKEEVETGISWAFALLGPAIGELMLAMTSFIEKHQMGSDQPQKQPDKQETPQKPAIMETQHIGQASRPRVEDPNVAKFLAMKKNPGL